MSEQELYQSQCLLVDRSDRGQLVLSDQDRLALLQRLSTNDLLQVPPGEGRETVLTSPIGRIIDLLLVLVLPEQVLLITGPGRGAQITSYLRNNIFFMDQVRVDDRSAEWGLFELYGPAATDLLQKASGANLAELPLFAHVSAQVDGTEIRIVRVKPLANGGWMLSGPLPQLDVLRQRLLAEGASADDADTYAVWRVEAGRPGAGELNQEYIPLEVGLWDAVSFNKGCYVGQEIIARMESRGRLAKRLMGLRLAQLPSTLPLQLEVDGKAAGDLTSAALSPRFGPIGLAFVRSAYAEPGTTVTVEGQPALVTSLPFE